MTPLPIHVNDIIQLYETNAKLKLPSKPDNNDKEPQDIVTISTEAKNRLMFKRRQDAMIKNTRETK